MANLYDLYDRNGDKEEYLGAFTPDEMSKMIGIPKRHVATYSKSESLFMRRYYIERAGDRTISEEADKELLEDYDYAVDLFKEVFGIGK